MHTELLLKWLGGSPVETARHPRVHTTDEKAMLSSLSNCLLVELGPRPLSISAFEALLWRFGLRVRRSDAFAAGLYAFVWPKLGAVVVDADLTDDELRHRLAHVTWHILLDSASVDGCACREGDERCQRADHGAKLLLVGDRWFGLDRLSETARHFGIPEADLAQAISQRF